MKVCIPNSLPNFWSSDLVLIRTLKLVG
jgi:hypothetical protein